MSKFFQFSIFKLQARKFQKGQMLVPVIIFSSVALVVVSGIIMWVKTTMEANRQLATREQAMQLAESGIDYYRWHLAHDSDDYQDGTGAAGPYAHDVTDKDGNKTGQFILDITPPATGSTKVTIKSTGTPASSTISRTIKVEMARPSLAKYAVAANDFMRFGEGTEIYGPVHSNSGIRFDGLAHNLITSALFTHDDPDHTGGMEFAVHTHVTSSGSINDTYRSSEAPPNSVPNRTDVFEVGREFPVPAIDFTGMTNDLSAIKSDAQAAGMYIAASGAQGYLIVFYTNGTFDLYKITSQITSFFCYNSQSQTGWNTWSVKNKTYVGNYAVPANGLIFVEDNVWIEGSINGSRVTIASGRFPDDPSNRPQIIVNNDLTYTNYDGADVIALISQGNISVGLVSDTNLRIDAALVSQNGRVGRYYYGNGCSPYHVRNLLTLYGMIASYSRYGFAYTDDTGYQNRNIIYDANLFYGPPPSFPLTSDQYQILSWEEI